MEENWFRILKYWQDVVLRHALGIPFLMGALRTPIGAPCESEEAARADLRALMDTVRNHHADDYYLLIYRCPGLQSPVLRYVKGSRPSSSPYLRSKVYIPTSSGGEPSLCVLDFVPETSDSPFNDLLAAIWSECGLAMLQGNFSRLGHTFTQFNDYELNIIKKGLVYEPN